MLFAEESYLDLMRSAPHWWFELTLEALTALAGYLILKPLLRRWIQRHDEQHHHGGETEAPGEFITWTESWFDRGVFACRGEGVLQYGGSDRLFVRANGRDIEVVITETWRGRDDGIGWEAVQRDHFEHTHHLAEADL
jgi:hypothetical protein